MRSRKGCIKHQILLVNQLLCKRDLCPHRWAKRNTRRNKSMKRIGWKTGKIGKISSALATALLVILAMTHPARSVAQATGSASIHGHVINPAGVAVNKGEV